MKFKAPKNTPKNRTRNKMPMYNQQPVVYSVKQPSNGMGCGTVVVVFFVIWLSIILYDAGILDLVFTVINYLESELWQK